METAQRRATITKLSRIPGYAEGGVVSPWSLKGMYNTVKAAVTKTPEQLQREADIEAYKAASEAERKAAKPAVKKPEPEQQSIAAKSLSSLTAGVPSAAQLDANPEAKAKGGPITGPGGPTEDKVPIMASPGEFVVRAAAVKEIGLPALRAINALGGNLPDSPNRNDNKYAEGDVIDPVAKHNAELSAAQSLASARASGASLAPGQEAVNRQKYLNDSQASDNIDPTTPYLRQQKEDTKAAANASVQTIYGTPSPVAQPSATVAPAQPQLAATPAAAPAATDVREPYQPKYPVKDPSTFVTPQDTPQAPMFSGGTPTQQDQGAAAALAGNYQAQARASLATDQYNREVAGAKAINDAGTRMNLEYDLKNGNKNERAAALAILSGIDATEKDKRGNAITTRGQDIGLAQHQMSDVTAQRGQNVTARGQDQNLAAHKMSDATARAQLANTASTTALDNQSKSNILKAQQALADAKTPEEVDAATNTLRAYQGKYGKEFPEVWGAVAGEKNMDGSQSAPIIYNKATGEVAGGQKPKAPAEGSISTVNGKKAKFTGGKWVPQ
jgi:hypothetical protein